MKISSNSFRDGGVMDVKYAMKAITGGKNISPHLRIADVPKEAKSLAIAFVDRHPVARMWVHWLATNIPVTATEIAEGASMSSMPAGTAEQVNTFGRKGYGGPQPPAGTGPHRYELTVYALSESPKAGEKQYSEREFLDLVKNKIVAKATIAGIFENR